MSHFRQIAPRLFNNPLALLPGHARLLEHLLRQGGDEKALFGGEEMSRPARDKPYDLVAGVAVIQVMGVLMHGQGYCWWGVSYYGAIRLALAQALGDPDVKAIALHIDSPGGVVNGCFDLADAIYRMRGTKPIWAILDEFAYSAAYALASAADRIIVPRTGGTGSIGVVVLHVDITKAMEQAGIVITTIQFGARKTDDYPTTKLSDPALASMQADIDFLGEMFVDTVARNRGLTASNVRDTQAETFLGAHGVKAGLADVVMSADEAFLALVESIG